MEEILKLFNYDFDNGLVFWKPKPESKKNNRWNGRYANTLAGTLHNSGYLRISVKLDGKVHYVFVHTLLWSAYQQEWYTGTLDHINRDKLDNRICNLRKASRSQNAVNVVHRIGRSGYRGVSFDPRSNTYYSRISINTEYEHILTTSCPVEAAKAYDKRATEAYGDYAITNKKLGLLEEEC